MIIATLKILPSEEMRREVLDILLSVRGPVLAEPGCTSCCIYEEYGDDRELVFIEQWRTLAELERHIRSSSYSRILEAMELSSRLPELAFQETGETWSLELVERVRGASGQVNY